MVISTIAAPIAPAVVTAAAAVAVDRAHTRLCSGAGIGYIAGTGAFFAGFRAALFVNTGAAAPIVPIAISASAARTPAAPVAVTAAAAGIHYYTRPRLSSGAGIININFTGALLVCISAALRVTARITVPTAPVAVSAISAIIC